MKTPIAHILNLIILHLRIPSSGLNGLVPIQRDIVFGMTLGIVQVDIDFDNMAQSHDQMVGFERKIV
jgi:hypothetical protein